MVTVLAPLQSEEDPAVSSEGAIDPLGLYLIADALGVRLAPGVRERQSRPRWLTTIAASMVICDAFPPETIADDSVSEPWQVFEWYIVEGLVRTATDKDDLKRLPGLLKARQAVHRDRVPLSAARYLKSPSVYGFHGVYRTLAREIDIESAGHLGEAGQQLIETWADEQGLTGFFGTIDGPGREVRERLIDAVKDGLKRGAVARKPGWSGWELFKMHMAPASPGPREAEMLAQHLFSDEHGGHRGEIANALQLPNAPDWREEAGGERVFHEWLLPQSSTELKMLVRAVIDYEYWSRLLTDAFDDCLQCMTERGSRTSPGQLAAMPNVKRATGEAASAFEAAYRTLEPFETETLGFHRSFILLSESQAPDEWVLQLLEHHRRVQRAKPPSGKNAWFEQFDNGDVMIRPSYLQKEGGRGDQMYVNQYRTRPLQSFSRDLGLLES